jgi:hypothetical protein
MLLVQGSKHRFLRVSFQNQVPQSLPSWIDHSMKLLLSRGIFLKNLDVGKAVADVA